MESSLLQTSKIIEADAAAADDNEKCWKAETSKLWSSTSTKILLGTASKVVWDEYLNTFAKKRD